MSLLNARPQCLGNFFFRFFAAIRTFADMPSQKNQNRSFPFSFEWLRNIAPNELCAFESASKADDLVWSHWMSSFRLKIARIQQRENGCCLDVFGKMENHFNSHIFLSICIDFTLISNWPLISFQLNWISVWIFLFGDAFGTSSHEHFHQTKFYLRSIDFKMRECNAQAIYRWNRNSLDTHRAKRRKL